MRNRWYDEGNERGGFEREGRFDTRWRGRSEGPWDDRDEGSSWRREEMRGYGRDWDQGPWRRDWGYEQEPRRFGTGRDWDRDFRRDVERDDDRWRERDFGRGYYGEERRFGGGSDYGRYGDGPPYRREESMRYGGWRNQDEGWRNQDESWRSQERNEPWYKRILRGPKNWKRSDERIREEVCERVVRAGLDAQDVEINVRDGEVTLTGTVTRRDLKRRIEDAAEDVMGVKDVHNQIRCRPEESSQTTMNLPGNGDRRNATQARS